MTKMPTYLPETQMFPLVKKAVYFNTETAGITTPLTCRTAESFELSFFDSGTGTFSIDHMDYDIRPGAVRFTRPGQTVSGIPPYSCYTIFFDFPDFSSCMDSPEKGCNRHNEILDSFPNFFYTAGNQKSSFAEAVELFYQGGTGCSFRRNALLMQILATYFCVVSSQKGRSPVVQKCVQYIQQNYSKKITLEDLSNISNYSALHIRRKFLSEMGQTPNHFLLSIRLTQAKKLLAETSMSIGAIATNCGFASEAYFYTAFREELHTSPGRYRKMIHSS